MSISSSQSVPPAMVRMAIRTLELIASRRRMVHYHAFAELIGIDVSRPHFEWRAQLGEVLRQVDAYDSNRNRPRLTSLVSLKTGNNKGLPSEGFWHSVRPLARSRFDVCRSMRGEVYAYPHKPNLTAEEQLRTDAVAIAAPGFPSVEKAPKHSHRTNHACDILVAHAAADRPEDPTLH